VTDPSFIPVEDRHLLAVFPDRDHAQGARTALLDAGVAEEAIQLGGHDDTVSSLRAEQHDELTRAWVVPQASAIYPGSSLRSMVITAVIAVAVVVPVALLLALVDFGFTYPVRAVIFGLVGLAMAFAIALVAGPPAGADRPASPPDATQGVTLRVAADRAELRDLLHQHHPIRVDEVTRDGHPIDTVERARPDSTAETLKDMAANVEGDDYHPQR